LFHKKDFKDDYMATNSSCEQGMTLLEIVISIGLFGILITFITQSASALNHMGATNHNRLEVIAFEESAMQGLLLELSEEIAAAKCGQLNRKIEERVIASDTLKEWNLNLLSLTKNGEMREHSIPASGLNRCKRSFSAKGEGAKVIYGCLGVSSRARGKDENKSTQLFKKKSALEIFVSFKDLESGKNVTCGEFSNLNARAIKLAYRLHQGGNGSASFNATSGAIYTGVSQ